MYQMQISTNKRVKSPQWDNPYEPINMIKTLKAEGWAGTVKVVDLRNNEIVHSEYICS